MTCWFCWSGGGSEEEYRGSLLLCCWGLGLSLKLTRGFTLADWGIDWYAVLWGFQRNQCVLLNAMYPRSCSSRLRGVRTTMKVGMNESRGVVSFYIVRLHGYLHQNCSRSTPNWSITTRLLLLLRKESHRGWPVLGDTLIGRLSLIIITPSPVVHWRVAIVDLARRLRKSQILVKQS